MERFVFSGFIKWCVCLQLACAGLTFAELPQGWVSVIDKGADPNGTQDSSPAFQAAIDSVDEDPNDGLAVVYVPPGEYLLNSSLLVDGNNVQIMGAGSGKGTRLMYNKSTSSSAIRLLGVDGNELSGFSMIGLALINKVAEYGGQAAPDNTAIEMRYCFEPVLRNLLVTDFGTGINLRACYAAQLEGIVNLRSTVLGISIDELGGKPSTALSLINSYVRNHPNAEFASGIRIRRCVGGQINGGVFEKCQNTGIRILEGCEMISINGVYFEGNGVRDILMDTENSGEEPPFTPPPDSTLVQGCIFVTGTILPDVRVLIRHASNTRLAANQLHVPASKVGIDLRTGVSRVSMRENTFNGPGTPVSYFSPTEKLGATVNGVQELSGNGPPNPSDWAEGSIIRFTGDSTIWLVVSGSARPIGQ